MNRWSKHLSKDAPLKKCLETPDILWRSDDGIFKAQGNCNARADTLVKPSPPQRKGPEDKPFTNRIRCQMLRRALQTDPTPECSMPSAELLEDTTETRALQVQQN